MSVVSSTERAAHYCLEAQTAPHRIALIATQNNIIKPLHIIQPRVGPRCGQHRTSHTRVPSFVTQAAYSSACNGPSQLDLHHTSAYSIPASQVYDQSTDDNAVDSGQQQRPSSPSGMVALMEAWGHLSTRLQQPPSSSTTSPRSSTDDAADDATTQLILSALKLAVRSLSRVSNSPSTSSHNSSSSNSGSKPAVQRSLALAAALAELYANGLPLDAASIAAGIVADAVDAAALHIRTVQAKLGQEVAGLVHDVLAVRHAPERAQLYDDTNSSALRGWLLTAYDVRACAIEVVWRWLGLAQPPGQQYQQQLMAMEALTIYCPLGHALGLGVCATALEDGAFKVLFPSSYASTARQVLPFSSAATDLLARCTATLQAAAAADSKFSQLASGVQLLSRTKSLYSIMRKLLRLQDPAAGSRRLGDMFDLLGMRAVVLPRDDLPGAAAEAAAVEACYRLQELAHQVWSPVPGRSKDYIIKPKPNGYQSLHSTLQLQQMQDNISSSGSSSSSSAVVLSYLELQIRTAAMHAAAEGGDAAHAGYKGRLERRQVRHLQQWTTQLQRRLAAPQQLLLLTLPQADSSSSSNEVSDASLLQPTYSMSITSSSDSDAESSSDSAGSCSSSSNVVGVRHQQQQQQQQRLVEHQPSAAAAAAASLFHHLDLDGDGMLSLYELTELLSELGELNNVNNMQNNMSAVLSASARSQQHSDQLSQQASVGSLQMTLAPATAAAAAAAVAAGSSSAAAYAQQVFELLDVNGDGLISMAEFLEFYIANTHNQHQQQQQPQQQQQQQRYQQQQEAAAAPAAGPSAGPRGSVCAVQPFENSRSSSTTWQRPWGVVIHNSWQPGSNSSGSSSRHRMRCWAYPPTNAAAEAAASSSGSSTDLDTSSSSTAAVSSTNGHNGTYLNGSSSDVHSHSVDVAAGEQQQQREDDYQQQLQLELSYEEDEQQHQRWLRQQQRRLPSLLADAAALRSPRYALIPVQRSRDDFFDAVGLRDALGQQIQQIEVPCLGPLLISNAPQTFQSTDVVIESQTQYYDRLALLLELVKPTGSSEAVLQARNLSRVVRGRLVNSTVKVNGGQTLLEPHRAAVELIDGDTLEFSELGVMFVVRLLDEGEKFAGHPATLALQRYCGVYASQRLGLSDLPVQEAVQQLQQQQQQQRRDVQQGIILPQLSASQKQQQRQHQQQQSEPDSSYSSSSSSSQPNTVDSYPNLEAELKQISRLVRTDARAAEVALSKLATAHPAAAGPWFVWAQLAASTRRSSMARDLFRAAAVCQQQQLDQLQQGGAAASVPAVIQQQQQQQQQPGGDQLEAGTPQTAVPGSSSLVGPTATGVAATAVAAASSSRGGTRPKSERSPAFRLSSRLVQVLRVWAKLEWDQRLFGPARRLWRLAANEAFKYPYDIAAEGGGAVLHAWASAEYERNNGQNARVVIGEALRKCPKDAAVAVLAASIEAAAGEYNAARALFLRAYQLNKADKRLYQYWPKMEGETGNIERARLLFQYGLSLYPNNTKILNIYACFEEEQGNVELARELHRRALGIDSASVTSMHNRVSWAGLELRQGNVEEAREMLRDGLDAHPDFPAAMLLLAKLELQEGNLDLAEAYARRVQKSHSFSITAMKELRDIYLARGEDGLAKNLDRHLRCKEQVQSQKLAGKLHGNEAWISFYKQTASQQQQELIVDARERKKQLGLIRKPRGRSRQFYEGSSSSSNGRGSGDRQQQKPEQQSEFSRLLEDFDFSAASAATVEQMVGQRATRSRDA